MAVELDLGQSDAERIFIDTDWTKDFKVADIDADATGATAKNIAGWTIVFDIRRKDNTDAVLLTKTASITGTFNVTLATSTQVARITVADTDVTTAIFGTNGGTFRYSLKRTDAGVESILAYGAIAIKRATQA
jgi:hypothetical protein